MGQRRRWCRCPKLSCRGGPAPWAADRLRRCNIGSKSAERAEKRQPAMPSVIMPLSVDWGIFGFNLCRPLRRCRNRQTRPNQEGVPMTPAESPRGARAALRQAGVEGFLIPHADEQSAHMFLRPASDWAGSAAHRSAGLGAVLEEIRAALFTDGRYTTQAQSARSGALGARQSPNSPRWSGRRDVARPPHRQNPTWLNRKPALKRLEPAGVVTLVALPAGPLDGPIPGLTGRPPLAPAVPHSPEYAGIGRGEAHRRRRGAAGGGRGCGGWPTAIRSPGCSTSRWRPGALPARPRPPCYAPTARAHIFHGAARSAETRRHSRRMP